MKEAWLSKVILFGERSQRRCGERSEYVEHYLAERNQQGEGNVLLLPRTRTSALTVLFNAKSSSEGSKPRPCCHPPTPPPCCSGRCWPQARPTCARLMAGRHSRQSPSINRLTWPPETIASCYRRSRHLIPTAFRTVPDVLTFACRQYSCLGPTYSGIQC